MLHLRTVLDYVHGDVQWAVAPLLGLLPLAAAHFLLLTHSPSGGSEKALKGPPLDRGWEAVTSVPLWPTASDPTATLFLKRPPQGPGMRYVIGGVVRVSTGTSFSKGDAARYEYRLVGRSKDGARRVLGDRATNRRGELRRLVGVRVERRPKRTDPRD